eukprot:6199140-Pleurochrysis_carterae.AAC.3
MRTSFNRYIGACCPLPLKVCPTICSNDLGIIAPPPRIFFRRLRLLVRIHELVAACSRHYEQVEVRA